MSIEDSMKEIHLKLLKILQNAYQELVKIHEDISFLNDEAREYEKALEKFLEAQENIFLFKNLWYELRRADDKLNGRPK